MLYSLLLRTRYRVLWSSVEQATEDLSLKESEIKNILTKLKDDRSKKAALMLKIRFRKFIVLDIKESNPLLKQQHFSAEQLSKNLKLLLQKIDLGLSSTATLADLEQVLSKDGSQTEASPCSVTIR